MSSKLMLVAVLAAVCMAALARPEDANKDELSNIIPQADGVVTVTIPQTSPLTTTAKPAVTVPAHKPIPVGTGFARFIDDIFQIPISVLKAVNTLLTNPFTRQAHKSA